MVFKRRILKKIYEILRDFFDILTEFLIKSWLIFLAKKRFCRFCQNMPKPLQNLSQNLICLAMIRNLLHKGLSMTTKNLLALAFLAACSLAFAKDYEIKMLNKGAEGPMVFEPAFVHIQPGDTITFVATDPTHNARSVVIPAGAEKFQTPQTMMRNKGEKFTIKPNKEGVYVYECIPHTPMGMVGIFQVGKATNAAAINDGIFKQPKAKERLNKYIQQIKK